MILPSLEAMEEATGSDPTEWVARCHEVSIAVVSELRKLGVEAVVRRGYFRGKVAPGAYFAGRPCQHSWVELPDGRVLDPTRFAFTGEDPWPMWIGPADDYDIGGSTLAAPAGAPPDVLDTSHELVILQLGSSEYLAKLLGLPVDFYLTPDETRDPYVEASIEQIYWLANLPIKPQEEDGVLGRMYAAEVYEAIIAAGHEAAIPIDRRDWILGDGGVVTVQDRIRAVVRDLGLDRGAYTLGGSAVMAMHGIDRVPGDVDVFLPTARWFSLAAGAPLAPKLDTPAADSCWRLHTTSTRDTMRRCDPPFLRTFSNGFTVDVFYDWRRRSVGNINVANQLAASQSVNGVRCMRLEFLLDWKREVYRIKDGPDIKLIEDHLAQKKREKYAELRERS